MSHLGITMRAGTGEWRALASDYERILHAWESCAPRVTFTDQDGAEITMLVSEISVLCYVSDEADAASKARVERERLEGA